MTYTRDSFIARAIAKHEDKYGYGKVDYMGYKVDVIIHCNTCDADFTQQPSNHLAGKGCGHCGAKRGGERRGSEARRSFATRATAVHGDKYGYGKVDYINNHTNVTIHCNRCDADFTQRPTHHLVGRGCVLCDRRLRLARIMDEAGKSFIARSVEINGDKYGYGKVDYINNHTNVTIHCNTCDADFPQTPNNHLRGQGCSSCANRLAGERMRRQARESFVDRATVVHGDKYGYDKVDYVDSLTNVIIHCNTCDADFPQGPGSHVCGNGCPACAYRLNGECKVKEKREAFVARATAIHGDMYGYDKVDYMGCKIVVIIHCNRCDNDFKMSPDGHINASAGCDACARRLEGERKTKKARESFTTSAIYIHGDKYGYDKVDYISATTNVTIHCNTCDADFPQTPNNHLNGSAGCYACARRLEGERKRRQARESFATRATAVHGDKYDYSEVDYVNTDTKVSIHCNRCSTDFKQRPHSHLRGSGCGMCIWKTENMVFEYLRDKYSTIRRFTPEWCRNPETGYHLPYDICIEQLKIIFEIDGAQHFPNPTYFHKYKSFDENHKRDMYKQNLAIENGYSVIRVVQEEIFNNKYDWKEEILDQINNIKTPEICYISIDDMYTEW